MSALLFHIFKDRRFSGSHTIEILLVIQFSELLVGLNLMIYFLLTKAPALIKVVQTPEMFVESSLYLPPFFLELISSSRGIEKFTDK